METKNETAQPKERTYQAQFVCLNCGMVMQHRQCKVRCSRCGYFEDCSDVGADQPNAI